MSAVFFSARARFARECLDTHTQGDVIRPRFSPVRALLSIFARHLQYKMEIIRSPSNSLHGSFSSLLSHSSYQPQNGIVTIPAQKITLLRPHGLHPEELLVTHATGRTSPLLVVTDTGGSMCNLLPSDSEEMRQRLNTDAPHLYAKHRQINKSPRSELSKRFAQHDNYLQRKRASFPTIKPLVRDQHSPER